MIKYIARHSQITNDNKREKMTTKYNIKQQKRHKITNKTKLHKISRDRQIQAIKISIKH